MRLVSNAVLAACLTVFSVPGLAATIFKCKDESGKLVFSDRECPNTQEVLEYKHPETWREKLDRERRESDQERAENARAHAERMKELEAASQQIRAKHQQVCIARIGGRGLAIGMSRQELSALDIWKYPSDSSSTIREGRITDYLVYDCDGFKSVRLFFVNDKLKSIHN